MKTGPLCSSYLHNGPVRRFVARKRKLPPVHVRRRNRPQRFPDTMRFSSNGYFFFFFVFFAFFAFFAFLAMLPSVIPKVGSMQVDIRRACNRLHHNFKIDIPRFEQGKRAPDLCDDGEGTRPLDAANPTGAADGRRQVFISRSASQIACPIRPATELEGGRLSAFENCSHNLWCEQG
jgi:hypothetical protein